MKFAEALSMMKQGHKMKLPSWGGFWYWDNEQETIMMQCRAVDSETGEDLLGIRETQRVECTINNILSDDWVEATGENCTVLGGCPSFGFDEAIKYVKRGLAVKRAGWNGKDQYIAMVEEVHCRRPGYDIFRAHHEDIGSKAIAFFGTRGVQVGWLASQSDMLANDWTFAE